MICDMCNEPLALPETLIIWKEKTLGTIDDLMLVHKIICDDHLYPNSSGAAYGRNWMEKYGEDISRHFNKKKFLNPEDKTKVLNLLKKVVRLKKGL